VTTIAGVGAERLALLLGLSLFFGFAFEEFYSGDLPRHPGGVRTFPLLALAGGALFVLEPHYGAAFVAGLLVVGLWIYGYVRHDLSTEDHGEGTFIVPISNVLAYLLGPIALTQPLWLPVAIAVAAVLLLGGKHTLHDWAHRVSDQEVITAGKFLILVGVVLPLLSGLPAIPHTKITPFGIWLAVVAVSTISYVSYLLAAYVFPERGTLLGAVLGGLYSSTATTVVLARRSRDEKMTSEIEAGIIAATAVMYVRVLVVCILFNAQLGLKIAPPILVLAVLSAAFAWVRSRGETRTTSTTRPQNPLQIGTALVFAALFVFIAYVVGYVQTTLGGSGVFGLAAVVGVIDIDPFVLSIAQNQAATLTLATAASAIIIATSSNNVLKAIYTVGFSRRRESWVPASVLGLLAAIGIAIALLIAK
jgi:uncharacterized membrane protein (DUF4010 family)